MLLLLALLLLLLLLLVVGHLQALHRRGQCATGAGTQLRRRLGRLYHPVVLMDDGLRQQLPLTGRAPINTTTTHAYRIPGGDYPLWTVHADAKVRVVHLGLLRLGTLGLLVESVLLLLLLLKVVQLLLLVLYQLLLLLEMLLLLVLLLQMVVLLLEQQLLLGQQLGTERLLERWPQRRLSASAMLSVRAFHFAGIRSSTGAHTYLSGTCRTGVPCRDRLVEEHIDVVRLADSQCCTSAFRRASSSACSVSLLES